MAAKTDRHLSRAEKAFVVLRVHEIDADVRGPGPVPDKLARADAAVVMPHFWILCDGIDDTVPRTP